MDASDERHRLPRDIQNIMEVINQFGNIQRYSRDHMMKSENDLEHTGFIVMFVFFVGKKLEQKGMTIDWSYLLVRALIHDIEETLTGDIPRTTKYDNEGVLRELKHVERKAAHHLCDFLGVDFYPEWYGAKNATNEGMLLKIADMAAVVYKTMIEVSMYGNRGFLRVSQEVEVEIVKMMNQVTDGTLDTEFGWVVSELHDILQRTKRGEVEHGSFFKNFGKTI